MALRILLIEDEPAISEVIKQGLEREGYQVKAAFEGPSGLDLASSESFALILLDVMLPGMDGWTVCRNLRSSSNTTPVLMLTARDTVNDKVRGLEIGADDYLPKPFDFAELLARVRALIRRDRVHRSRHIRVADLEIDTSQRRVMRAGNEISLTPREYSLLEALASREGQVLTRDLIQERVWQDDESYSNTVDVYIGTLRKKIDAGYSPRLIHTVHGVGYLLRVAPEDGG